MAKGEMTTPCKTPTGLDEEFVSISAAQNADRSKGTKARRATGLEQSQQSQPTPVLSYFYYLAGAVL